MVNELMKLNKYPPVNPFRHQALGNGTVDVLVSCALVSLSINATSIVLRRAYTISFSSAREACLIDAHQLYVPPLPTDVHNPTPAAICGSKCQQYQLCARKNLRILISSCSQAGSVRTFIPSFHCAHRRSTNIIILLICVSNVLLGSAHVHFALAPGSNREKAHCLCALSK